MNIIHVVSSLNTGGAEKFVKNISAQQKSLGHNVIVISFGCKRDTLQNLIEAGGIDVVNLTGGLFSRLKKLYYELTKADVAHIHSPAVIRAILPISPFLLKHNIVYTIHGEVDPPEKLLSFAHKVALVYLKRIVAVSESSRESVTSRYGWNISKVKVIKNGVEIKEAKKTDTIIFPIQLGIVSRLIPLKNISLLFDALEIMKVNEADKFSVNIFGSGPDLENIKTKAYRIDDKVKTCFWGNVVDENAIYGKVDLLIMCSDSEGLPMSILEAMANKIPVVSTNVGAIPNVITPEHGWLYNRGKAQELAEILKSIVRDVDKIRIYGIKSREFVSEHYSIVKVEKEYNVIYAGKPNG